MEKDKNTGMSETVPNSRTLVQWGGAVMDNAYLNYVLFCVKTNINGSEK